MKEKLSTSLNSYFIRFTKRKEKSFHLPILCSSSSIIANHSRNKENIFERFIDFKKERKRRKRLTSSQKYWTSATNWPLNYIFCRCLYYGVFVISSEYEASSVDFKHGSFMKILIKTITQEENHKF